MSATGPMRLALRDVSRRYGGRPALDGLTLEVAAGSLVALVGANGAGKSTLLRAAAGRLRLDGGTAAVDGLDPRTAGARLRLGYIPQDAALFPHLTVRENVEIFAALAGMPRSAAREAARRAIAAVNLTSEARTRAQALSGGMRKRASVAAGLAHAPSLVLADEPLAGVDLDGRDHVHALLRSARDRGAAVVMATHDLEGAEEIADRVVLLASGKVQADAAPAALVRETLGDRRQATVQLRAAPSPAAAAELSRLGLRPTAEPRRLTREIAGTAELDALLAALREAGLAMDEVRLREPGLRAALLHLTGEEEFA